MRIPWLALLPLALAAGCGSKTCNTSADCAAGATCDKGICYGRVVPGTATGGSQGATSATAATSSSSASGTSGSTVSSSSTSSSSSSSTSGGTTVGASSSSTSGSIGTTSGSSSSGSVYYCQPCEADSDCGGTDDDAGISSNGNYCLCADPNCEYLGCGTACQTSNDCQDDAVCTPLTTDDGGVTIGKVCVPAADAGFGECAFVLDAGLPPTTLDAGQLVAIPLSGCPILNYQAPVTIGGSQTFQLSIDTGSTDMGVALSSCETCTSTNLSSCMAGCVTPEYTSVSDECSSSTSSSYESGEWSGEVCNSTVQLGAEMPAANIEFAGINKQYQFFLPEGCDGSSAVEGQGIVGLGPLDLDTIGMSNNDSYFSELAAQGVTSAMGFLLCTNGGIMWFGGYDSNYATPGAQLMTTPLANSSYWAVDLSGVGLGSTSLGGADSCALLDTGTGTFSLATTAVDALASNLQANAAATALFDFSGAGGGATSWSNFFSGQGVNCIQPVSDAAQAQIDQVLPPLTLTFPSSSSGSFTLTMPATQSYLVQLGAVYCNGVSGGGGSSGRGQCGGTIIGATALRAYIMVLDQATGTAGFIAQNYCP